MKPRRAAPLALFALLAALLGVGLTREPQALPSPLVDRPAPAFRLPRLDAPSQALGPADLRGQVWLLNVWASWCAACRVEHPLWVALAREQGVPLVGLNLKDDHRAAQEWLRRHGDPYVHTVVDVDGRVGIDYGVYGVPETFVIDRAGIVRHRHAGPVTQEVWQRELKPLIERLGG